MRNGKTRMKKKDGISIVIPTVGRLSLVECINSIHLDPTLGTHEVLVVTYDFLDDSIIKLLDRYECIKYIKVKKKNVSFSRNVGITSSNLKIISFIDDDDIWLPHRSNALEENLSNESNLVVFGSARIKQSDNDIELLISQNKNFNINDFISNFSRNIYSFQAFFLQVGNCALLNQKNIPKFREELGYLEDQIWIFELLLNNWKVMQTKTVTLLYHFSRGRSNLRWKIETEIKIIEILEMLMPGVGKKYLENVSLKSIAISGNYLHFINSKNKLEAKYKFSLVGRMKIYQLGLLCIAINILSLSKVRFRKDK